MVSYIINRFLMAILTVIAISMLSFLIIQLPPGDYVTSYIASMSASGSAVSEGEALAMREQLGLDKPIYIQYLKWMGLILQGNLRICLFKTAFEFVLSYMFIQLKNRIGNLLLQREYLLDTLCSL